MFRHWPADRRTSMSVPGARWPTSRGAPSTRRHSPSGTLSSSRGIRPGKVTDYWVEQRFIFFYFTSTTKNAELMRPPEHYRERDRRRREREWERERWCGLSFLMSRSLSRERSGSSFFWGFSGEASLTSFTDSTFFTSTTVSLQVKETPFNS